MFFSQLLDALGGEVVQDVAQSNVQTGVPGTVDFKIFKQEQGLLDMVQGETVVDREQGVGQDVEDGLFAEIGDEVKDIVPQTADIFVLGLSHMVGQDVELAAVLRKIGGDLFADEGVVQMGDFQAAGQGIVVGDGHQIHAPLPGNVVKTLGLGKAFRAIDFLQDPLGRALGKLGVHVQIALHRRGHSLPPLDGRCREIRTA